MGSYTLDKSTLERSVSESDLQDLKCFLPVKKACTLNVSYDTSVTYMYQAPGQGPKPTGRVLTSTENMMLMEEKERVKKEKALEKEARLKAHEEKRLEKAREKERKDIARKGGKGRNSRLSY